MTNAAPLIINRKPIFPTNPINIPESAGYKILLPCVLSWFKEFAFVRCSSSTSKGILEFAEGLNKAMEAAEQTNKTYNKGSDNDPFIINTAITSIVLPVKISENTIIFFLSKRSAATPAKGSIIIVGTVKQSTVIPRDNADPVPCITNQRTARLKKRYPNLETDNPTTAAYNYDLQIMLSLALPLFLYQHVGHTF